MQHLIDVLRIERLVQERAGAAVERLIFVGRRSCSAEIITTLSDGWMSASRFMVSSPLMPGMLQSRNTTSNCELRHSANAVSPSPASVISQLNTLP